MLIYRGVQGHEWTIREYKFTRVCTRSQIKWPLADPHSYLRAIANVPSTESNWTLDPRMNIEKAFDKGGVPRGVGNQVSCEFNLLYRFHSAISNRDAEWTKDFYAKIFPNEDPLKISIHRLLQGITEFERGITEDPSERTFAGLVRQKDGAFKDEDLVRILKESIEDPAGTLTWAAKSPKSG